MRDRMIALAHAYRHLGDKKRELKIFQCSGYCGDPWCPKCVDWRKKNWLKKQSMWSLKRAVYVELRTGSLFDQKEWTVKEAVDEAREWIKLTLPDLKEWHRSLILRKDEWTLELIIPFWVVAADPEGPLEPPNALWQVSWKPIACSDDREELAERMVVGLDSDFERWDLDGAIPRVEEVPRAAGWVRAQPQGLKENVVPVGGGRVLVSTRRFKALWTSPGDARKARPSRAQDSP